MGFGCLLWREMGEKDDSSSLLDGRIVAELDRQGRSLTVGASLDSPIQGAPGRRPFRGVMWDGSNPVLEDQLLIHACDLNVGIPMRSLTGIGASRSLQGRPPALRESGAAENGVTSPDKSSWGRYGALSSRGERSCRQRDESQLNPATMLAALCQSVARRARTPSRRPGARAAAD